MTAVDGLPWKGGSIRERADLCRSLAASVTDPESWIDADFSSCLIRVILSLVEAQCDNNVEVRITAEESLRRVVRSLVHRHAEKILATLFRCVKATESPVKARLAALRSFSDVVRWIRPLRARLFITAHLLPVIGELLHQEDEGGLENFQLILSKILRVLGRYFRRSELLQLVDRVHSLLLENGLHAGEKGPEESARKRKARSLSLILASICSVPVCMSGSSNEELTGREGNAQLMPMTPSPSTDSFFDFGGAGKGPSRRKDKRPTIDAQEINTFERTDCNSERAPAYCLEKVEYVGAPELPLKSARSGEIEPEPGSGRRSLRNLSVLTVSPDLESPCSRTLSLVLADFEDAMGSLTSLIASGDVRLRGQLHTQSSSERAFLSEIPIEQEQECTRQRAKVATFAMSVGLLFDSLKNSLSATSTLRAQFQSSIRLFQQAIVLFWKSIVPQHNPVSGQMVVKSESFASVLEALSIVLSAGSDWNDEMPDSIMEELTSSLTELLREETHITLIVAAEAALGALLCFKSACAFMTFERDQSNDIIDILVRLTRSDDPMAKGRAIKCLAALVASSIENGYRSYVASVSVSLQTMLEPSHGDSAGSSPRQSNGHSSASDTAIAKCGGRASTNIHSQSTSETIPGQHFEPSAMLTDRTYLVGIESNETLLSEVRYQTESAEAVPTGDNGREVTSSRSDATGSTESSNEELSSAVAQTETDETIPQSCGSLASQGQEIENFEVNSFGIRFFRRDILGKDTVGTTETLMEEEYTAIWRETQQSAPDASAPLPSVTSTAPLPAERLEDDSGTRGYEGVQSLDTAGQKHSESASTTAQTSSASLMPSRLRDLVKAKVTKERERLLAAAVAATRRVYTIASSAIEDGLRSSSAFVLRCCFESASQLALLAAKHSWAPLLELWHPLLKLIVEKAGASGRSPKARSAAIENEPGRNETGLPFNNCFLQNCRTHLQRRAKTCMRDSIGRGEEPCKSGRKRATTGRLASQYWLVKVSLLQFASSLPYYRLLDNKEADEKRQGDGAPFSSLVSLLLSVIVSYIHDNDERVRSSAVAALRGIVLQGVKIDQNGTCFIGNEDICSYCAALTPRAIVHYPSCGFGRHVEDAAVPLLEIAHRFSTITASSVQRRAAVDAAASALTMFYASSLGSRSGECFSPSTLSAEIFERENGRLSRAIHVQPFTSTLRGGRAVGSALSSSSSMQSPDSSRPVLSLYGDAKGELDEVLEEFHRLDALNALKGRLIRDRESMKINGKDGVKSDKIILYLAELFLEAAATSIDGDDLLLHGKYLLFCSMVIGLLYSGSSPMPSRGIGLCRLLVSHSQRVMTTIGEASPRWTVENPGGLQGRRLSFLRSLSVAGEGSGALTLLRAAATLALFTALPPLDTKTMEILPLRRRISKVCSIGAAALGPSPDVRSLSILLCWRWLRDIGRNRKGMEGFTRSIGRDFAIEMTKLCRRGHFSSALLYSCTLLRDLSTKASGIDCPIPSSFLQHLRIVSDSFAEGDSLLAKETLLLLQALSKQSHVNQPSEECESGIEGSETSAQKQNSCPRPLSHATAHHEASKAPAWLLSVPPNSMLWRAGTTALGSNTSPLRNEDEGMSLIAALKLDQLAEIWSNTALANVSLAEFKSVAQIISRYSEDKSHFTSRDSLAEHSEGPMHALRTGLMKCWATFMLRFFHESGLERENGRSILLETADRFLEAFALLGENVTADSEEAPEEDWEALLLVFFASESIIGRRLLCTCASQALSDINRTDSKASQGISWFSCLRDSDAFKMAAAVLELEAHGSLEKRLDAAGCSVTCVVRWLDWSAPPNAEERGSLARIWDVSCRREAPVDSSTEVLKDERLSTNIEGISGNGASPPTSMHELQFSPITDDVEITGVVRHQKPRAAEQKHRLAVLFRSLPDSFMSAEALIALRLSGYLLTSKEWEKESQGGVGTQQEREGQSCAQIGRVLNAIVDMTMERLAVWPQSARVLPQSSIPATVKTLAEGGIAAEKPVSTSSSPLAQGSPVAERASPRSAPPSVVPSSDTPPSHIIKVEDSPATNENAALGTAVILVLLQACKDPSYRVQRVALLALLRLSGVWAHPLRIGGLPLAKKILQLLVHGPLAGADAGSGVAGPSSGWLSAERMEVEARAATAQRSVAFSLEAQEVDGRHATGLYKSRSLPAATAAALQTTSSSSSSFFRRAVSFFSSRRPESEEGTSSARSSPAYFSTASLRAKRAEQQQQIWLKLSPSLQPFLLEGIFAALSAFPALSVSASLPRTEVPAWAQPYLSFGTSSPASLSLLVSRFSEVRGIAQVPRATVHALPLALALTSYLLRHFSGKQSSLRLLAAVRRALEKHAALQAGHTAGGDDRAIHAALCSESTIVSFFCTAKSVLYRLRSANFSSEGILATEGERRATEEEGRVRLAKHNDCEASSDLLYRRVLALAVSSIAPVFTIAADDRSIPSTFHSLFEETLTSLSQETVRLLLRYIQEQPSSQLSADKHMHFLAAALFSVDSVCWALRGLQRVLKDAALQRLRISMSPLRSMVARITEKATERAAERALFDAAIVTTETKLLSKVQELCHILR